MNTLTTSPRVHYLDAARATMLLLGIPFHASEIYRFSGGFTIDSPDASFAASAISGAIHLFRMPGFFLLSGYFAALLLARRERREWLTGRLWKLGIPLLATTILLGPIEVAIAHSFNTSLGLGESLLAAIRMSPTEWINHRWFLIVLIIYCICAALLDPLATKIAPTIAKLGGRTGTVILLGSLLLAPFAAIVAGKLAGEWIVHAPVLKQYANSTIKYLPFFVIGYSVLRFQGGLNHFLSFSKFDVLLATLSIAVYLSTYFAFYPGGDIGSSVFNVIAIGCECIAGYYGAKAFFWMMNAIVRRESLIVSYFVQASFCIYLVHELFLLTVGGVLLAQDWPPLLEIALIVTATIAGAVAVFEAVRRSTMLSQVFNGGPIRLGT